MKKLASLAIVLIFVICMATTAFAADPQVFDVNAEADLPTSITLEAGETATLNINDFTLFNRYLKVTGDNSLVMVNYWTSAEAVDGVASIKMEGRRSCIITIENKGAATTTYALEIFDPVGSMTNPEAVADSVSANITIATDYAPYYYYFEAPDCGTFYINDVVATAGAESYNVTISTDGFYENTADIMGANWLPTSGTSLSVKAGDKVVIMVTAMDYDGEMESINVSFTTSFEDGHSITHFDAVEPGCHYDGNIEYWFCSGCEGFWQNEALTQVTNSKRVILPATGAEVTHFDAVEPGCHYEGNIEYWFCAECEQFWQNEALTQVTNSKRVILPATGGDVKHVEAAEPECHTPGNIEYWYCTECEQFWQNEALTQLTNSKNVKIAAENALEYHKMVAGTCTENGMNEYWYCAVCECFYSDADGKYNVAYLSLTIPAAHNFVDGKCTVCGDSPATGDAGIIGAVAGMLVTAMSTVALVSKKKEF